MTRLVQRETIAIGNIEYAIGENIVPSPEAILSLESLKSLVIARQLDKSGKPATIKQPTSFSKYPTPPVELSPGACPSAKRDHDEAMALHVKEVREFIAATANNDTIPVPPVIGYVKVSANEAYFQIEQLDDRTPRLMPYAQADQPAETPFNLHIAEIVE